MEEFKMKKEGKEPPKASKHSVSVTLQIAILYFRATRESWELVKVNREVLLRDLIWLIAGAAIYRNAAMAWRWLNTAVF